MAIQINNLQEFDIIDALELAALIDQEIQLISDDVSVGIDILFLIADFDIYLNAIDVKTTFSNIMNWIN